MFRLSKRTAIAATTALFLSAVLLSSAQAGSNGQQINGINGHAQNGICLSGYNQSLQWVSNQCNWLNNVQPYQSNHLSAGYWWIGDQNAPDGIPVYLESYTGLPYNPQFIGSVGCAVPQNFALDWYSCQAY